MQQYKLYMTTNKNHKICGKNFRINAIFVVDEFDNIYLCQDFPINYTGKNPFLTLHVYDSDSEIWNVEPAHKDEITKIIWNCYIKNNRPRMINTAQTYDDDYSQNVYARQKTPDDSDYANGWYLYKAFQGGDVRPK